MPEDSPYDFVPEQPPTPTPSTPAPSGPAEKLEERTCPHCGFKSYGKPRARCPECAAPTDVVATDILQFSPTDWTRSISIGFLLAAAALLTHVLAASLRGTLLPTHRVLIHLAASLLMLFAVFQATRKEPILHAQKSPLTTIAKIAAAASLLFWFALVLTAYDKIFHFPSAVKLFTIPALLSMATLAISLGFYAAGLAVRIPNDSIAAHAINAGWVVAAMCFILLILHAFELTGPSHVEMFFCSFPLIAMMLAVFLWAAVTLLRLTADLRNAATAGDAIITRKAQRLAAANKNKK